MREIARIALLTGALCVQGVDRLAAQDGGTRPASADARAAAHAPIMRRITVAPNEQLATWLMEPAGASIGRVLLLPSVLGSVYSMQQVAAMLVAERYTVLVVDPLGMGASDRPRDADYTLAAQAARLVHVLDSVGWSDTRIAAQGTSATIAFRLAALVPTRISLVVSMAGGPIASQQTDGVRAASRFSGVLNNRIGRALARRKFAGELRERSADPAWVNDLSLDAYLEPLMRDMRGTLRTLQHMSVASEPTPIDAVLAGIRAPVVVLVGERPTPSSPTPEQLSLLRRVLPRARVDTVPGVGAMLHEEAPSAVVAAIVDAAVPTCPCDEASAAYVGSTLAAGRRQRE